MANDVAKYFAIIPAMFAGAFPQLNVLNIMHLRTPQSAILSAVVFNALIIIVLIPLALRGVRYRPVGAAALLRRNLLIYGLGGVVGAVPGNQAAGHAVVDAARGVTIGDQAMKKDLKIAVLFTVVTTVVFGLVYPFVVTALAQFISPDKANGELVQKDGKVVGSRLLGQAFTGPGYFHSRPSAAGMGNGYDSTASGGSNLGPTNKMLQDRVNGSVKDLQSQNPGAPVPIDLVTTSASGLDPDITPASAEFQVPRVAKERQMSEADVRATVTRHTLGRQFGFLGEARVNVLALNLDLDQVKPYTGQEVSKNANQ